MTNATAHVSEYIEGTPDEVWKALTDPHLIREYFLGATVDTDWKVGSPITWTGAWEGLRFEDKGEVLAHEPNRRLSFSHWSPLSGTKDKPENYHRVDIDLIQKSDGTEVSLTQSNLTGKASEEDRDQRAEFEDNWRTMLTGLHQVVTGED